MMTRIFIVVMLSVVTLSVVLQVGMTPFSEPRVTKLFFRVPIVCAPEKIS